MTMIDFKPTKLEATNISRPRSRARLWGASLVVIAALGAAAYHYGVPLMAPAAAPVAAAPAAPAGVPVSVAKVEQRDTPIWNEFSGRLEAVGRVEVRPRVAGAVMEAHFREGALVKKGDVLFTIDPAPYAAEVRRLEAQIAAAGARLVLAGREQQRGFSLGHTNDLPQRDIDARVNEYRAAEANLRGAQAALEATRLNLDWTEVRAPISGRVGKIEVTPGNLVPAGSQAPVLTTLVSVSPIYASFEADERSVERVMESLPETADLNSEIGRSPVRMGTLATETTPFEGKLQLVDNVVDARSGTIRVRAVFENADGRLMPGQFARLRMGQARTEKAIAVAEGAVGTDQDRRFVMVVGDDNKAAYRAVKLGGLSNGLRIVTDGLKPGERIVVGGLQRIRPGALVAPKMVSMPTPDTTLAAR
jgi:multidrug efflux system membrane fusion protein